MDEQRAAKRDEADQRGKEWRYRPVVWTKDDTAPPAKLLDGPGGMAFQGADLVWTPGRNDTRADVRISVGSDDLKAEQRFRLTVVDDPDDDR